MGILLRNLDPSFDPASWGAETLAGLLQRIPDMGTVERRPDGHPQFRFGGTGLADGAVLDAESVSALSRIRLRPDFWAATTAFRPPLSNAKFDLQALRVVSPDQDPDALLSRFPERFVSLPDTREDFQKDLARRFLGQAAGSDRDAIEGLLGSPDWLKGVAGLLKSPVLAEEWLRVRRGAIVAEAFRWADCHGIRREALVPLPAATSRKAARGGVPSSVLPSDPEDQSIRGMLHSLIDALSEEELRQLLLPAWVLEKFVRRRAPTPGRDAGQAPEPPEQE